MYILADMLLRNEELRTEVILCHYLIVLYGHRPNSSKYQVLGNFVRKSSHTDQKDICRPKPRLIHQVKYYDTLKNILTSLEPLLPITGSGDHIKQFRLS